MKPTTIFKTVLLSLLLVGMTGTALAQQPPDRVMKKERMEKMREMRQHHDRMPRIPDLTDQQKEQIKDIMLTTRQAVLPLQNQMREKAARLKTLRTAEKVDMEAVNSVIEEIGDIRTQIMKTRVASEQEIRELLTEEQRVIFDSRSMRRKHLGHQQ